MKLTLTLGALCLVNCVIQNGRDTQLKPHGNLISTNQTSSKPKYEDDTEAPEEIWPSFDDDMKQVVFKSPFSDMISDILLDQQVEDCMKDDDYIFNLLMMNRVVCNTSTIVQSQDEHAVQYSIQYLLDHFHLPTYEDIVTLIASPNDQFDKTLFSHLQYAGINPNMASLNGKGSIYRLISGIPGKTKSSHAILDYYWRFVPFHHFYLDRAFERISNSLSIQEYFEFETLLDWIQTTFSFFNEEDWKYIKAAYQKHYKVSRASPSYWEAWYEMRPLKDQPV